MWQTESEGSVEIPVVVVDADGVNVVVVVVVGSGMPSTSESVFNVPEPSSIPHAVTWKSLMALVVSTRSSASWLPG